MSKMKKIAILAIVAMVLTMLPVQMFAATADSTRLSGTGRVETALDICSAGWTTATTVVVAPADQANLVDALAVAPLAGQENAPILLTFKDALDPAVKAKITALGASKVYVVGAISDSVKNEIAALSGVTVEVLKGASRWDTTKAINAKLTAPAGTFVVGYNAIPDALSVASYAAKNKYAIVLADVNGAIPAGQSALGTTTYVIGGPTLVADIAGATRIAGADRFETNTKVAQTLSYDYARVYVANGLSCVDALSVAPLAAKYNSFVALASASDVAAASYLNGKLNSASKVIAVGGTAAVSDSVVGLVKAAAPLSLTVQSIQPVSLNSFKVVFNQKVDSDTAETESNYKVNGTALDTDSSAEVLSDGQTVLVTIGNSTFTQNSTADIEVLASSVYDYDKKISNAGTTISINMGDTTVPAIESISPVGNAKLKVYFTEPINLINDTPSVGSWKIDGNTLTSLGLTATKSSYITADGYTNRVDLYFATPLAAGSHTFTVTKGEANGLGSDLAGFIIPQSDKDFTVDSATGAPTVQSVTVKNNTVYVTFDRPMYQAPPNGSGDDNDTNSALNTHNYSINDKADAASVEFEDNTGSKVVKVGANVGEIKTGTNVINISKDVKDAFGNVLSTGSDDLRYSFDYVSDTTKPTVVSVTCLTSDKIKVVFSEPVDSTFAKNSSNYELRDSNGETINLSSIETIPATGDQDTVQITPVSNLRGTGYTLKIKNIVDTATDPNVMDTYTATFDGLDDQGPTLVEGINDTNNIHKVYLYFSESLDGSKVIVDNFGYTDNSNPTVQRALPTGSTVAIDGTGKMVTVTFPDAYKVIVGGENREHVISGDLTSAFVYSQDKYTVTNMRAANVTDKAGNVLQGVAETLSSPWIKIALDSSNKPTFSSDSLSLYDNGDNIRAEFTMNQEITSLDPADFRIATATYSGANHTGTITGLDYAAVASSGYTQGKKVVLNFTDQNAYDVANSGSTRGNVAAVRKAGPYAYLITKATPGSTNIAGVKITDMSDISSATDSSRVYDDQVAPRILDMAVVASGGADDGLAAGSTLLKISFSEAIDGTIAGLYNDDFTVSYNGTSITLNAPSVDANGNIYYNLGTTGQVGVPTPPGVGLTSGVFVKAVSSKIDIRDTKDRGAKNYNVYVPKQADINGVTR